MEADNTRTPPPSAWRAWLIVVLLFFFMFINYADKAVLGFAQLPIQHDLQLSNTQYGDIASSFYLLFAVSSVVIGFVANRLSSRWLLLGMGLAWAATQFPIAASASFTTLLTCRILLGASEGPAYPLALHATYKWFDDAKRTLPTNLLVLGAGIGTAASGLTLPVIIVHWGWQAAFLTVGLIGLAWSLIWLAAGREGPLKDEPASGAAAAETTAIAYRHLLLNRTMLGVFLVCFAAYWAIAAGLAWGYGYMIKIVGLTPIEAGQVVILPTLLSIVIGPLIATASQTLARRGVSSRYSRGAFGCAGALLGGLGIAAMALMPGAAAKIACYAVASSITFVIYTVGPPIIAELAPARQRAAVLAINNAIYSTAGIVAPSVMGRVLDAAPDIMAGYRNGYLVIAALLGVAGVVGFLLIDPAGCAARIAARHSRAQAHATKLSLAE